MIGDVRVCTGTILDPMTNQPVNCGVGIEMCDQYGAWGPCYFYNTTPEVCNNWDDDCDGQAHHGLSLTSEDGSVVVVGARENAGNGTDAGHTRVFRYVDYNSFSTATDTVSVTVTPPAVAIPPGAAVDTLVMTGSGRNASVLAASDVVRLDPPECTPSLP